MTINLQYIDAATYLLSTYFSVTFFGKVIISLIKNQTKIRHKQIETEADDYKYVCNMNDY